ncbi:MAG: orotate phosphoribosyltransferase [Proteobacteria bacterium]|nr:orotate phosphoribosyltransferase [Pseudomonadota bacterium]
MTDNISEKILKRNSELVSLLLWEAGAIKVNIDEPFKLVSGNYSPIYINCRSVISSPSFMKLFAVIAQFIIERNEIHINTIAGGETAGIPFAAYLANSLSLSMIYVRKAKKDHGIANLVEGTLRKNAEVLLVEDLITDGGSKIGFINSIQNAGASINHTLVLFDRLQGGMNTLKKQKIKLHKITDMNTVLKVAADEKLLYKKHLNTVHEYIISPEEWHMKLGLDYIK